MKNALWRGWRPLLWIVGAYIALNIVWTLVRSRVIVVVLAMLIAGCGTAFAILVHPQTGTIVECRENLFDGITDTIGRCVAAYEQAGFKVQGRR